MPPTMLIDSLHTLRRKVKVFSVLLGVGIVVASTVGVLLATVLLDYLLNLSTIPRLFLIVISLGTIGYVMFRWVVLPLLAKLSISDLAGRLEKTFPQFDDRLRSTVDFVASDIPGSGMMKDRVVSEATNLAKTVELNQLIVVKPIAYSVIGAVTAVAIVFGLARLDPSLAAIALARLLHPAGNAAWPKSVEIGDFSLPARVPVGERINVVMSLIKGHPSKALVYYSYDNGPEQKEYMTLAADGTYSASLDARGNSLKVWTSAGDDDTQARPSIVAVVPRLAIDRIEAVVSAPAYAKLPPVTVNLAAIPAVITYASTVSLNVTFNKSLDPAHPVDLQKVSQEMNLPAINWQLSNSDPRTVIGTFTAAEGFSCHLTGHDTDGFTNIPIEEYQFIVRPDQMPTVRIETPTHNQDNTPTASFPLRVVADDDFGLSSMQLVVQKIGDNGFTKTIDLLPLMKNIDGTRDRQTFAVDYQWDLANSLGQTLKPGDVLQYHVEVRDNFSLPGKTLGSPAIVHDIVSSGMLRINIRSPEEIESQITALLRDMAHRIDSVEHAQNNNQALTNQLAQDTHAKPEMNAPEHKTAEQLINQQASITSQTRSMQQQLETIQTQQQQNNLPTKELKDIVQQAHDSLKDASDNPMKDASEQLNNAENQKSDPKASADQKQQQMDQRNQALSKSQESQGSASQKLDQAKNQLGTVGDLSTAIKNIEDMLKKQQDLTQRQKDVGNANLGKKPEEMSPEDRKKEEQVAKEQGDASKQMDKMTSDMAKLGDSMSKSDPTAGDAMKQAAQQSKDQNVSGNQQQASQSSDQNQQSQAQQAQQQAEIGLRQMLSTLREAEARKLAQLVEQLIKLSQLVDEQVRRQAGHNLDNLGIQGPDAWKTVGKLDDAALAALIDEAGRDPKNLPKLPELPDLVTAQEQTQRNTDDGAGEAEKLPNSADVAASLHKAAGRMSDAIVDLRDKKLEEAYDPYQVEALKALEDAKKKVDEQKAVAQQALSDKQREALRGRYENLRKDQLEQINTPTIALDGARDKDGNLNREDAIKLNNLPATQDKLAETLKDIDKDVQALDSVVYNWANRDILKSMGEVKDDLGQGKTAMPTQSEQKRILAQLDAMIKDLATKPPDPSKFANAGGGGKGSGGGSKKPKLPTAAELRLLQDLQLAVNDDTKTQNDLPAKDDPKLLALGNRQDDLRNVFDELIQKATQGQAKLAPKPSKDDKLPEEANQDDVENQELDKELLTDKPKPGQDQADSDISLLGDRMARSTDRLSDKDPGKVTQLIQKRIVLGLDDLIKEAEKQQQQQSSSGQGQGQPQGQGPPKPGQGQGPADQGKGGQPGGQPQPGGSSPADKDTMSGGAGEHDVHMGQSIVDIEKEWGAVTKRDKQAVMEGASEKPIEKYKSLLDDYYKEAAAKATQGNGGQ